VRELLKRTQYYLVDYATWADDHYGQRNVAITNLDKFHVTLPDCVFFCDAKKTTG